jgi:GTPase SAR1 family protein
MNVRGCVDRLRSLKLDHEHFRVAYNRSYAQASLAPPGQVIAIVGPTRVGKTTLSRKLAAELVRDSSEAIERSIPLIRIEAATTHQGKFSTKHFTLRALQELADPISTTDSLSFRRDTSETHLRLQLEQCIRYRKTHYMIIDEAHHLLRTPSQVRAGEVLDTFKCLGNATGLVTIFVGGYELLRTCFSSAHLNGRLTVIDFPPYTISSGSTAEMDRILLTLDEILPFAPKQSLLLHRDFIYAGSLGCLGMLIGWAINALAEMQACGDKALTISHFEATRSAEQIRPIREEIALGQELLNGRDLELQAHSTPTAGSSPSPLDRRQLKPFVRKPKRDPGPKIVSEFAS